MIEHPNSLPETRSPQELLVRQAALQAGAPNVAADLMLTEILSTAGQPVQVGRVALGLMVWRGIDITVLCLRLDIGTIFGIGERIIRHPRVRGMQFRNDTGHWNQDSDYPDGFFWGIDYRSDADKT